MVLSRLAGGLLFVMGLVLARLAVVQESWPVLLLGMAVAGAGLVWFVRVRAAVDDPFSRSGSPATR